MIMLLFDRQEIRAARCVCVNPGYPFLPLFYFHLQLMQNIQAAALHANKGKHSSDNKALVMIKRDFESVRGRVSCTDVLFKLPTVAPLEVVPRHLCLIRVVGCEVELIIMLLSFSLWWMRWYTTQTSQQFPRFPQN